MNRTSSWTWWPVFHDASYAPGWREQLAVHWRANLLMLASPRAVLGFCLLSGWPVLLLIGSWWLLRLLDESQQLAGGSVAVLATMAATLLAFLVVQHLAFVVAMNRTYGPFVRRAMNERGTPVCPACGHLLPPQRSAGTPHSLCSECGARVDGPALR